MNRRARACLAWILCCAALPAAASSFVPLDVDALALRADRGVVAGRVLSTSSQWNEEGTMIWTTAEVLVTEDLAGGDLAGSTLRLRVPGGSVDGTIITMEGAPEVREGEEIAVFVTTWPDDSLKVLGYYQGLSRLALAPDGAPRLTGGSADGMTLDELRSAVRAAGVAP